MFLAGSASSNAHIIYTIMYYAGDPRCIYTLQKKLRIIVTDFIQCAYM